jgi:hypothetical protein
MLIGPPQQFQPSAQKFFAQYKEISNSLKLTTTIELQKENQRTDMQSQQQWILGAIKPVVQPLRPNQRGSKDKVAARAIPMEEMLEIGVRNSMDKQWGLTKNLKLNLLQQYIEYP